MKSSDPIVHNTSATPFRQHFAEIFANLLRLQLTYLTGSPSIIVIKTWTQKRFEIASKSEKLQCDSISERRNIDRQFTSKMMGYCDCMCLGFDMSLIKSNWGNWQFEVFSCYTEATGAESYIFCNGSFECICESAETQSIFNWNWHLMEAHQFHSRPDFDGDDTEFVISTIDSVLEQTSIITWLDWKLFCWNLW